MIRARVSRTDLRAQIARALPFEAEIVICDGRKIVGLLSGDFFARQPTRPDVVRFVSVLSRAPRSTPRLPIILPPRGPWLLKVLTRDDRFVVGVYRRQMQVIGYLGSLDRLFGVPATTRSWSTLAAVGRVLAGGDGAS